MQPDVPKREKETAKQELKFGLPGTPDERQKRIRAAMKKHAETLRRLAQ